MTKPHFFPAALANREPPSTMADLLQVILSEPDIPEVRRRNVASSIRRFCAVLELKPEHASATFWFFREKLERFHPSKAGLKPHRWETIRSDVAFALKRLGLAPDQPKPRAQRSNAWTVFMNEAHALGFRPWGLSRLARYCDAEGLAPVAVDDGVMAAYKALVRTQTFKTKPEKHLRDVCVLWNRIVEAAPNLALQTVSLISNRQIYSPAWGELPLSLQQEIEAWLNVMSRDADLLSESAPIRPLRPASIKSYRYALLQAVAGLIHSGRPLETIDTLAELVEPDAATAALQFHLDRNGNKPSQMVAQIAHVLVLVGQHAVGVDSVLLAKLKRYRAKLSPTRSGLRPRPRTALRQFADQENIEKLLILPQSIHKRLSRKHPLTVADARLMQVAVALELLLMRPIRRANLVALRRGEHVLKAGGRTLIVLDESEVNRVAHDYAIPPESARLLDFYVTRLLPLLGDNRLGFLFPGVNPDKPKSAEQFGRFFSKTILAETGLEVYPHLLRHFAATLYLTEKPEGLEVVRRVLGHRSAETTHRSYNGTHDQAAVRRFDEFILGIRGAILKEIAHV